MDEPTHILNMKRGILSAFQINLIKNDETVTEVRLLHLLHSNPSIYVIWNELAVIPSL